MANLVNATERASILAVFEDSFDTWCRDVIVYKQPLKVITTPQPSSTDNVFGFGSEQKDNIYTYDQTVSGLFKAVIRDSEIESAARQAADLSPEMQARILTNPISMKVRPNAFAFIEDGPTEKVIDVKAGITFYINGVAGLQTYMGSTYYVYPLRKIS